MYILDLALNNLQWLICHKTKPNQTKNFASPTAVFRKVGNTGHPSIDRVV